MRASAPGRSARLVAARRLRPEVAAVLTLIAVTAGVATLAILMMSSGSGTPSSPAPSSVYLGGGRERAPAGGLTAPAVKPRAATAPQAGN